MNDLQRQDQSGSDTPGRAPGGGVEIPRPPAHRALLWAGVVAVVLAVAAGLVYRYWNAAAAGPSYRFGTVTRGPVTSIVIASGTVNAVVTVQVGSQVSGQIKELYADFNTEVKKGQLIARIDPDAFETHVAQAQADVAATKAAVTMQQAAAERAKADLESARSNLTVAKAQIVKAQAGLVDAERDYKRKRELATTGSGALSDRDKAEALFLQSQADVGMSQAQEQMQEAAIRSAEAQIHTAEANVDTAIAQAAQKEAALRAAQVDLDHTYIRAPVDGTVILRNVDVGQTVAASLQAPVLFTIAQDLRAMQVDTSIDEADVGAINVGQQATFAVDAHPGQVFHGEVLQVRKAPQVVQNVVTYDVVISAPNPDLLLLPGLTANVQVVTAHRDDALLIPNAALRYGQAQAARTSQPGSGPQVYAIGPDGKPQPIPVTLGIADNNVTEVLSGAVQAGQQVVTGETAANAAKTTSSLPGFGGPRM